MRKAFACICQIICQSCQVKKRAGIHHMPDHFLSPQMMSAQATPSPLRERAGVRVEHTALVDIPFTLCSLLLCNNMTSERARAAQSPPPWRPGLPAVKSPLRGTLSLFLQAIGSGVSLHPCRPCPLGASLRLAPALRKRFGDLQPDQGIAVSH